MYKLRYVLIFLWVVAVKAVSCLCCCCCLLLHINRVQLRPLTKVTFIPELTLFLFTTPLKDTYTEICSQNKESELNYIILHYIDH